MRIFRVVEYTVVDIFHLKCRTCTGFSASAEDHCSTECSSHFRFVFFKTLLCVLLLSILLCIFALFYIVFPKCCDTVVVVFCVCVKTSSFRPRAAPI